VGGMIAGFGLVEAKPLREASKRPLGIARATLTAEPIMRLIGGSPSAHARKRNFYSTERR